MKPAVLACFLLLLSLPAGAVDSSKTYYQSNSIGQRGERLYEIDMYDDQIRSGYVLHLSKSAPSTRELVYSDRLIWRETQIRDGAETTIERRDGSGKLISSRTYIQELLQREIIRTPEMHLQLDYRYDRNRHLVETRITYPERDLEAVKHFYVSQSGALQGLLLEPAGSSSPLTRYSLLTEPADGTVAIGLEGDFTTTLRGEGFVDVTSYSSGEPVRREVTKQLDLEMRERTVIDNTEKIREVELLSADGLLLSRERYELPDQFLSRREFTYDDEGSLTEELVETPRVTRRHAYTQVDGHRREHLYENDELIKIIDYYPQEKKEQLFIDREYYATITYAPDGTIKEITYE